MEVAADRDRVAGLPHRAYSLARVDAIASFWQGRAGQVGVEVAAIFAFAVNEEVVAVEDGVVAGAQDAAVAYRDQRRVAGGDDVEALVGATAAARGAEFADRATRPVRAVDREDVGIERRCAIAARNGGRRRGDQRNEENEAEKGRALQWCSITRSTRLYSFASSALMK